ncbi:hypothetical protein [Henriciella litoralis]|uniref:hypothetical protein n=1 Tax=Henriciella litoralis TaxID=568102 RepID=UPI00111C84F5|nr:hypothetical protein [Henriciella litoralis]
MIRTGSSAIVLAFAFCVACSEGVPDRPDTVPESAIFHRPGPSYLGNPAHWMDCAGEGDELTCNIWLEDGRLREFGTYRVADKDWCSALVQNHAYPFRDGFLLPVNVRSALNGRLAGSSRASSEFTQAVTTVVESQWDIKVGQIEVANDDRDGELFFKSMLIERLDGGTPLQGSVLCDLYFTVFEPDDV